MNLISSRKDKFVKAVAARFISRFILFAGILFFFQFSGSLSADTNNAAANPSVREVQPGVFEIGKVRLHKNERFISFPATINMTNGPVEYFLVTAVGKLHESVLKTDVDPMHLHLAALLLGAKGAQTNLTVKDFDTNEIPGEKVDLLVQWKNEGGEQKARSEEWVFNTEKTKIMEVGKWVYNGSQLHGGEFIAQRDGLVISIISDPLALINNPRTGRQNDEIWIVNSNAIPPLNTSVQCIIQFSKDSK